LHGAATGLDGADGVGKAERSGGDVGGPLAEGVAGGQGRLDAVLGEDAPGGDADGENGRLGVFGEAQVFLRTFKDDFRERKAEGLIGFGKGLCGDGEASPEFAAHANGLRTLPRKKKGEFDGHFREHCNGRVQEPRYGRYSLCKGKP